MIGDVIGLQSVVRRRGGRRERALDRRAMITAAIARRGSEHEVRRSHSPRRMRSGKASSRPPSARIFTDARKEALCRRRGRRRVQPIVAGDLGRASCRRSIHVRR